MPNRAQRRNSQNGDKPRPSIYVEVEGHPYRIYFDEITAEKEHQVRQLTATRDNPGINLVDVLRGDISMTGVAGIVWAYRSLHDKKLAWTDVLKAVTLADLSTVELDDGEAVPDDGDVLELEGEEVTAGPPDFPSSATP